MTPPITAMVAGTAPPARTWLSSERAVSRFSGCGIPWVMMVLSSATTGRPPCSALRTSGDTFRYIYSLECNSTREKGRMKIGTVWP